MVDTARIETHYLASKDSMSELLRSLTPEDLSTPVPACPGWSVLDVVRHLVGNVEDAAEGKLSGPPDEEQTADQVASRADRDLDDLLASWDELGPTFAATVAAMGVWPAVIDAVTHEHDIRHALGRPGERDGDRVRELAAILAASLDGEDLRIETPTTTVGSDTAAATLRTTDFELFRVRMGRRSRAQIEALDWQGDPAAVIGSLHVFGPSPVDIQE